MNRRPFLLAPLLLAALPLLWFACSTRPPRVSASAGASSTPTPKPVPPAAPVVAIHPPSEAEFHSKLHPFLETYCVSCHSGEKPKGDLDLGRDVTPAAVTHDVRRWSEVLERVEAGEMPPDDAEKIPSAAERRPVVAWLTAMRAAEAQRLAGDPGLVLARRLSNAEYDYSIRDLTGVDLRPTKEFPVDPANEAGFDNTGESLTMSPDLVHKYLDAAGAVADHLVFKPDGLGFSPYPMTTDEDRDNFAVHRIVEFYRRQSLDYADFFVAAWRYRHRAALGRGGATLADFANEGRLSPKYLARVWGALTASDETVGPMAAVQARWRKLPGPQAGVMPAGVRTGCVELRDLIAKLRPLVKPEFANLVPDGHILAPGSQTLVLWKDDRYAASRTTYAGNAAKLDLAALAKADPLLALPAPGPARDRYEVSFQRFCAVFPDAFYIAERARMFLTNPKDIASDLAGHRLLTAGFHSQMGYYRDDAPLCDLVLDPAQRRELDRLWAELDFIARVPFRQFRQFVWFERAEPPSFMLTPEFNSFRSEDDDLVSEAKIKQLATVYSAKARQRKLNAQAVQAVDAYFVRINASIRSLEHTLAAAEPRQLDALLDLTARAWRRPLTAAEREDTLAFYRSLRAQKLSHEDAVRDSVVSVLMAPAFCYRFDLARAAARDPLAAVRPLTDYELASRLSYFLWSSLPDAELLGHAAAGDLHRPDVLTAQARRMVRDARVRGLATEFGGNWLDIRRFEEHNAVDRGRFPSFTNDLRAAMFEEPVRFFADLAQRDGSVLDFIYGDYTWVNAPLARHYGMPAPADSGEWVRIDGAAKYQRGGLLPMAAFLTKNAPGLRTSPVKRGHWVVTRLLGERIPAPPPNVPVLPSDEAKLGDLTLRDTLARHRADKSCASCHNKFDSFGLVFEGFGPVGEVRQVDLAGHAVETTATFPDGSEGAGLAGLRAYFHARGEREFLDNLSRKLLSYALGRTLVPSDDPLLATMRARLAADDHRFGGMIEEIVTSRQFLNKRTQLETPGNYAYAPDP